MFDSLSDKLGSVFAGLRGKKSLSAEHVDTAMREIRVALLEADVALPVVKDFINDIKDKAVGEDIIKGVDPAQQVVKIVHDGLVDLLGGGETELNLEATPPVVILMAGLQGSGKTTTTGKLAKYLSEKQNKKTLMASLDVARPAAQEQLAVLGEQTGTACLDIVKGQTPIEITKRAMDSARKQGVDVLLLDTAGRLSIDDALMAELATIRDIAKPTETLLVADSMTGQDAVNTARIFNEKIGVSGIILTRADGDARGGAAMSMKMVTGAPVKMLGTGEKLDAIEPFHPDRVAGRILGMGDVVSLVEKAVETIDTEQAEKMAKKFKKGEFDLDDFAAQLAQMKKMGGASSLMKMLPGLGKMAGALEEADIDNTVLKKQGAILSSMTKKERRKPDILNTSRKRRIATGSGTTVQEVNRLLKQFGQMQKMMKQVKKMGMGGMMKAMKGMMGDQGMDQLMASQGMDPKMLDQLGGADMPASQGPLGPNPFAGGPGGLPDLSGLGGLGGGSKSRFTKSRKSKRKKK